MQSMVQPLPPEAVAGIDQRAGACNAALDELAEKYRKIAAQHGTSAAVGVIGSELHSVQIRAVGNIIDMLAFAIARIAETEQPPSTPE